MSIEHMKKYMLILESDYVPAKQDPNISYDATTNKNGDIDKVIATLTKSKSAEFTKLAKKIQEAKELSDRVKKLEAEIKGEAREAISGLFKAEDEVYTRIVETASFSLKLTKVPEPTVTVKYASVIKELRTHLSNDLISILDNLEYKFRTVTEKSAALSFSAKNESINEESNDLFDKLKDYSDRYLDAVESKLLSFDTKLEELELEVQA